MNLVCIQSEILKSIFRNRTSKQSSRGCVPTTSFRHDAAERGTRVRGVYAVVHSRSSFPSSPLVTESRFDRLPYSRIETRRIVSRHAICCSAPRARSASSRSAPFAFETCGASSRGRRPAARSMRMSAVGMGWCALNGPRFSPSAPTLVGDGGDPGPFGARRGRLLTRCWCPGSWGSTGSGAGRGSEPRRSRRPGTRTCHTTRRESSRESSPRRGRRRALPLMCSLVSSAATTSDARRGSRRCSSAGAEIWSRRRIAACGGEARVRLFDRKSRSPRGSACPRRARGSAFPRTPPCAGTSRARKSSPCSTTARARAAAAASYGAIRVRTVDPKLQGAAPARAVREPHVVARLHARVQLHLDPAVALDGGQFRPQLALASAARFDETPARVGGDPVRIGRHRTASPP